MSIQLIVYPQSYEGTPNPISANITEFVVDGINFNTVSTSTIYSPTSPYEQNAINYYSPLIAVNQWDRFTPSGELDVLGSGGQLFFLGGGGGQRGLIQKLSSLTIGDVYNVTFDIASVSGAASILTLSSYTGTTPNASNVVAQTVGLVVVQFTAISATDIISINYKGVDTIVFNSISIANASRKPSGSISHLGDGQVICDLYEDEDIPLTLSVDDFKNVAEKVQSYSKAFNLPATKRNNQIFDNIFEITRSDDGVIFNPYKKTQCILKQDGFILFEGYLRLLDVTDKEGEISFNVNLYSEVVALADVLKDRAFRDLDFTELEHDYTVTQVQLSWNDLGTGSGLAYTNPSTSGFRKTYGTLRYPFVNWINQYTPYPTSVNLPNLESTFRPFINIKYILDRIFNAPNTPFSYSSDFFDTADFEKLYMDFNWGASNSPISIDNTDTAKTETQYSATSGITFQTMPQNDNSFNSDFGYSSGVYTAQYTNQTYTIDYTFNTVLQSVNTAAYVLDTRWEMVKGGITTHIDLSSITGTGDGSASAVVYSSIFTETLNIGDTLTPQWKFQEYGASGTTWTQAIGATTIVSISTKTATTDTILQTLRGELGQWDFIKGLMTMFNLVALSDESNPNNIIIEPYADVFIAPSLTTAPLNWTDKIDVSEMKLEPLTELNKNTIFKFVEDDDDSAFTQYKNQVGGHLYGSKKYDAGNEFNILEGLDEIIAEPFAATVVKPLFDNFPQFITPALYSYNADDDTSEGFDNSPRIMYNNGIKSTGINCYVPAQNGSGAVYLTSFLQFSHLSDVPTVTGSIDFHFGECQLLVGASTPNNLFSMYWLPYYNELYNPNTRIMTIKVNLSPSDINTFKFNDTVLLKNRVFRVNKIDYKPNDLAKVEFILIP